MSDDRSHNIPDREIVQQAIDVDVRSDRLIVTLELRARDRDDLPVGESRRVAALFVHNDQIVELQMAGDREAARAAAPSPPPPPRPAAPTTMTRLAAVLPVLDLAAALQHYDGLGFTVSAYSGGGYGYAERDGLNLHFCVVPDLDPTRTTSAVYLYVDDADVLFAEWRSAGVSGQFFEPHDTDYGLREGSHIDRDGNLLRFGSRLRRQAQES